MNNVKNIKIENLKQEIEGYLIDYYANSITGSSFVENIIRKKVNVDNDTEEKICEILALSQRDWDAIECDKEGANSEQEEEMDNHIENVTLNIIKTL